MTEDRIERALEDDYLSRDPSISKRAAYIRRTMELRGACLDDGARISPANIELTSMLSQRYDQGRQLRVRAGRSHPCRAFPVL